ncbi:hypothetical protein OG216_23595 [Streptomycetaceae bacterium NBC_01309]
MSLGTLISVERNGAGVALTIQVPGVEEYVVVFLDEQAAAGHAVDVLDKLDQPAREHALDRAKRDLDAFAGERHLSALLARRE